MERTRPSHRLYKGEWGIPGGRIEASETEWAAVCRKMLEELGCAPLESMSLPLLDCTAPGAEPFFVRPFVVHGWIGEPPAVSGDRAVFAWRSLPAALASPVAQVRMMVAAALSGTEGAD